MLHTKFQGNPFTGSGEVDFFSVFNIIDVAAMLNMGQGPFKKPFVPPTQGGYIVILVTIGKQV